MAASRIWDTSTGQCLRTLVHEDNPAVTNVCFSPNGRFVLAFSLDNSIRLWDYVSGSVKKTYQGHTNKGFSIGGCFAVLTDADDNDDDDDDDDDDGDAKDDGHGTGTRRQAFITSASEDGDIVLWDVGSKAVVQRITGAHAGVCFWVDVHGETMVSAGQDGLIKVFRHVAKDRRVKRENCAVNGHGGGAVTPDTELQRCVEAAAAGSPGQHVKEEQP